MDGHFRDNAAESRFELEEAGKIAFADYRRQDDLLVIDYVEAAPALRGTGAADRLMSRVVDVALTEKLKIVPRCGYAASWLRRHREHHALLV
jgi:predicted GNAT family acetyltransferase